MVSFLGGLAVLLFGYLVYSRVVEKIFGAEPERQTPANALNDGVDFTPMPTWKVFLIQLLNIAGLGPITGAIQGALFGPVAFIWIALGCVFAGAVHDYISGMMIVRHKGASLSEIHGLYLGKTVQRVMRFISLGFLVFVGVAFVSGPAALLASLTKNTVFTLGIWIAIVFAYYFLATILPIDVLIGKLYPIFGAALIVMAVGVTGGILFGGYTIPEITFANLHPNKISLWPMLFVTIACGAISGFHATQSPLMARCMKNEKNGRSVFYGSMIAEGVLALVWAAAGLAFYNGPAGLGAVVLSKAGPLGAVNEITKTLLGPAGALLAMLGVVACPITTGDTAFRSARLTLADILKYPQDKNTKRLLLAVPLFAVGVYLSFIDYSSIWRYVAWLTQTFAMITLWACSVYLVKNRKNHWITTVPAVFMSAVCLSYILQAKEGLKLAANFSNMAGLAAAALCFAIFMLKTKSARSAGLKEAAVEAL
jgi:carbon starvation protein CstA